MEWLSDQNFSKNFESPPHRHHPPSLTPAKARDTCSLSDATGTPSMVSALALSASRSSSIASNRWLVPISRRPELQERLPARSITCAVASLNDGSLRRLRHRRVRLDVTSAGSVSISGRDIAASRSTPHWRRTCPEELSPAAGSPNQRFLSSSCSSLTPQHPAGKLAVPGSDLRPLLGAHIRRSLGVQMTITCREPATGCPVPGSVAG